MRTVLVTDEMLAHAVAQRLDGEVEIWDRARWRDEGEDAVRRAVTRSPCVLVIGAAKWDPTPHLKRWRLPARVPVVALVPELGLADDAARAAGGGAFSVVPLDRSVTGLSACLGVECRLARARPYQRIRPVPVLSSRAPRVPDRPG